MMWLKRRIRDWVEQANDEDYAIDGNCGSLKHEENTPEDVDSYTLRV